MRKVIITGSPGSGKSTLLNELGIIGFQVMPESFRWLKVLQSIEEKSRLKLTTNMEKDSLLLLSMQKFIEERDNSDNNYCFFDRCMIDIFAYCRFYAQYLHIDLASKWAHESASDIFCAFLLPVPDKIEKDNVRTENLTEARRLNLVIQDAYKEFGVKLHLLSSKELNDRVGEIINFLEIFEY